MLAPPERTEKLSLSLHAIRHRDWTVCHPKQPRDTASEGMAPGWLHCCQGSLSGTCRGGRGPPARRHTFCSYNAWHGRFAHSLQFSRPERGSAFQQALIQGADNVHLWHRGRGATKFGVEAGGSAQAYSSADSDKHTMYTVLLATCSKGQGAMRRHVK